MRLQAYSWQHTSCAFFQHTWVGAQRYSRNTVPCVAWRRGILQVTDKKMYLHDKRSST